MKIQCKYCDKGCIRCDYTGVREQTRAEIDEVLGTSMCACGKCSSCEYYSYKTQEYLEHHNILPQEARNIVRRNY